MTHPNDEELGKTAPECKSDTANDESSSSPETDTLSEKDAFFTESTVKKKISPLFIFIIGLFIIVACLIFGYIYNIGNMRSVGQKYSFPASSIENISADNNETPKIQVNVTDAEKSSQKNQSSANESEDNKVTIPDIPETVTQAPVPQGLDRETYIEIHYAITHLNEKIDNSERYLDELIAVKTFFPNITLPVMTYYSNSSMPSKIEIVTEAMKALRRAATLPNMSAEQDLWNKFSNIIRYFIVITPTKTANVSEHDGRFALLKQALKKGDLAQVLTLIASLNKNEQAEFKKIKRHIEDYFTLQTEKKSLQDALLEKLYPSQNDKGKKTL